MYVCVILLVIGFPIDCSWLQLCIGSHGHVCDLGLSAHAVYLWFYTQIICAVLVTVYYCTVLYCTVLMVLPVVRHSHLLGSHAVVNSGLSLILFHKIYGLYLEH